MSIVKTGLDRLIAQPECQQKIKGNIGYLCHSASIDSNIEHGLVALKRTFGDRLKTVFSPQHGFVSDVQDNMVESDHYTHPYFNLKIYSLYSETREPTNEMLAGLDSVIIDLQDVGTRIYTYIYTMTLMMKKCRENNIKVFVLDRPNPVNCVDIEGNILEMEWKSFVGLHPMPTRHALSIGEVALMANKYWQDPCDLEVIAMENYKREMSFEDTGLPWVLPSPNLATIEAAYTFVGTVLFEGTNISEGRGTTRSLEMIGHPAIEPFSFLEKLQPTLKEFEIEGCVLRPCKFLPTFQKHAGSACGGFQIHVTDRKRFKPWKLTQLLCREFYHELGSKFEWKVPPYEYEYEKAPINLINGNDSLKAWVENRGSYSELQAIESKNQDEFLTQRKSILIYS